MSAERITPLDPRMRGAVAEMQDLIAGRYPEATFAVSEGEDPEGVYLIVTVDTDDLTDVLEVVGDRLVDIQVEANLPLYVVPTRPSRRVLEELQQPRPRSRLRIDLEETAPPA